MIKKRFPDLFEIPLHISGKKANSLEDMWYLGKNMLYTPKISGQAKSFRRAMLAHLQGISLSAGGTPYNFFLSMFLEKKMLVCFFLYRCFYLHWSRNSLSPVCGIFYSLSEMEVGHINRQNNCLFTYFKNNTQLRQSCDKIHCIPTSFWQTTPSALFMT